MATESAVNTTDQARDGPVPPLRKILASETEPLAQRFRALFSLKFLACLQPPTEHTLPAIEAIAAGFSSSSSLLKHELAYCLGQTRNHDALAYLNNLVQNKAQDTMSRHEAAEALGSLGFTESLDLLRSLRDDETEDVVIRETCDIAVDRVLWENSEEKKSEKIRTSDFASIDPAPPLPLSANEHSVTELKETLLNTELPLFKRYRAMFALRDLSSPPDLPTAVPAIQALAEGLKDPSALLRHEIAFVFGQIAHPASIPSLIETLSNTKEAGMVRHEAAEALGSLGDEKGVEEVLKIFSNDSETVVRDSITVALDMAEYERNGEKEYAIIPPSGKVVA